MSTVQVSWVPDCCPKSLMAAADGWLPGMMEMKYGAVPPAHLMRVGTHWVSDEGDSMVGSWA